ncbi:glycosyltransferase family 2 protein [Kistimonas asteriae]|uniref:glycosyltransferase family 2 protein n=1 Tax=Kistimonas asteriae TaxID=517724 RepID=UPI001BAA2016|nr:glycosyltransferase family 2 protein [Kistimonas asteriae]
MKTEKCLFSVVIPAYNYADSLPRALESVLQQSGNDYEVLIVDDGSTDNTRDVIDHLRSTYPGRFDAVTRENSGPAAVRNFGINNTTGEWLIFLDADDELMPDALDNLRRFISEHDTVRIIVGGHMVADADGSERYRGVKTLPTDPGDCLVGYLLKKTITPSNGATAMHRSIFQHCRYPEQFRNSEDIPVFAYALTNFESAALDKPLNRIHKHSDSLRHNLKYANDIGTRLIEEVFREDLIPAHLQKYKRIYAGQRCLSLFRTFYLAGQKQPALKYYREALGYDWRALFKISYTKKAIRLLVA